MTDKRKAERASREIDAAVRKIQELLQKSEQGTLDRRKLESGLQRLEKTVSKIPTHWPIPPHKQ